MIRQEEGAESRLDQTGRLQGEECGPFLYHHCHLSRGRSCQRDCQCTCVLCVSAYLRAVSSYAEGRKTITTHLAAAIAAYTGGKETLTPLQQPAAQTDTYSPDHRKDARTSADGMSVTVDTGKRRTKRGMFITKSLSCGMLLSAQTWVSWLHLQLDNHAEPFKASFRSDSVAWLFPRTALITRPLAHTRSRRVIIWRRLRRELPA